jgi:rare lipoprotein A
MQRPNWEEKAPVGWEGTRALNPVWRWPAAFGAPPNRVSGKRIGSGPLLPDLKCFIGTNMLVLSRLSFAAAVLSVSAFSALANSAESPWVTEVHVGPAPAKTVVTGSLGPKRPKSHALDGIASYYWQEQMTASGEKFNKRDMTAAHPSLPFGTLVEVTNTRNGKKTVVRINDRGPFKPGRIIDVSEAAAEVLDMTGRGLAPVKLQVVSAGDAR